MVILSRKIQHVVPKLRNISFGTICCTIDKKIRVVQTRLTIKNPVTAILTRALKGLQWLQ